MSFIKSPANSIIRQIATSDFCKKLLNAVGHTAVPIPSTIRGQRADLLSRYKIKTVIDVGGHVGFYGKDLRQNGFKGRICSFEPDPRAFIILEAAAALDTNWTATQIGLGSQATSLQLRLNEIEGGMTSLLPLTEEGGRLFPKDLGASTTEVEITTLNTWIQGNTPSVEPPFFLKIDTQGFEMEILAGSNLLLENTSVIEIETPLRQIYEGAVGFSEVNDYLSARGFKLVSIHTDRWLGDFAVDCDCLFARE